MKNPLIATCQSLGLIGPSGLEELGFATRDVPSIKVLRCPMSGIVLLDSMRPDTSEAYVTQDGFGYWDASTREEALLRCRTDDARRALFLRDLVEEKRVLDVGTGAGELLDELKTGTRASQVDAVEPQAASAAMLRSLGYTVHEDIARVDEQYDVITLMHVLEHLEDPVGMLRRCRELLSPGGTLVVEVPHARDILLQELACDAFAEHSFWSEHLMLHTRQSLGIFIEAAGFDTPVVSGLQRYPLANHMHWLAKSMPGGHDRWSWLRSDSLDAAYGSTLDGLDRTDTIVALARRN